MKKLGAKGLLLLSALAFVWPEALSAQANGGGSKGKATIEENDGGKAGAESGATGSIGGTAPKPEGTSGGSGPDVTLPSSIPADGSRMGNPCPPGYLISEDGHMCARP